LKNLPLTIGKTTLAKNNFRLSKKFEKLTDNNRQNDS